MDLNLDSIFCVSESNFSTSELRLSPDLARMHSDSAYVNSTTLMEINAHEVSFDGQMILTCTWVGIKDWDSELFLDNVGFNIRLLFGQF